MPGRERRAWPGWWRLGLVAAGLFLVGEVPYAAARAASPPEHCFGGVLLWVDDVNMYFSFVRQAAEGRWLFENRLTHVPHAPAFFNPEFLAVGRLERWTGLEDIVAFEAWRGAGVAVLLAGFCALLGAAEVSPGQRWLALGLFALGGGFGWLAVLLDLPGLRLDLHSGLQPFAQMLLNPHFSLPHGLVLIVLALFLQGERTGRSRWYVAAAAVALLEVLVRPYDLLTLGIALPLYVLLAGPRTARVTLRRALPVLGCLPAAAYFFYLFRLHPVFRYWASQGRTDPVSFPEQAAAFGLVGIAAAGRILAWRARPLAPAEKLLLAWLLAAIAVVHLWRLAPWLPFSAQAGSTAMAPLVVLALPVLPAPGGSARWWGGRPGLIALVGVNALSSAVLLYERTSVVTTHINYYHLRRAELDGFAWLRAHARPEDVVLADEVEGNRLGRFASSRVVLGHWSVTPQSEALRVAIDAFLKGGIDAEEARRLLGAWRVRWVYSSPRTYPRAAVSELPECARRYQERGIAVDECDVSQVSPKAGGRAEGPSPETSGPKR
jgi:hypothetical protein